MLFKYALVVSVMYISPQHDPTAILTTSIADVYGPWDSEAQCQSIAQSLVESTSANLSAAGLKFVDSEYTCSQVETRKPISVFIESGAVVG